MRLYIDLACVLLQCKQICHLALPSMQTTSALAVQFATSRQLTALAYVQVVNKVVSPVVDSLSHLSLVVGSHYLHADLACRQPRRLPCSSPPFRQLTALAHAQAVNNLYLGNQALVSLKLSTLSQQTMLNMDARFAVHHLLAVYRFDA